MCHPDYSFLLFILKSSIQTYAVASAVKDRTKIWNTHTTNLVDHSSGTFTHDINLWCSIFSFSYLTPHTLVPCVQLGLTCKTRHPVSFWPHYIALLQVSLETEIMYYIIVLYAFWLIDQPTSVGHTARPGSGRRQISCVHKPPINKSKRSSRGRWTL